MASKKWCGSRCADCQYPCNADMLCPCSLDCANMKPDGIPDFKRCGDCECVEIWKEILEDRISTNLTTMFNGN